MQASPTLPVRRTQIALALGKLILIPGLVIMVGCNGDPPTVSQSNPPTDELQVTPSVEKNQTTSVAANNSDAETSPANQSNSIQTDSEPEAVCERFMELLKTGNRIAAENLLTRSALTTTSKAGLQLEPMGGPSAKYEISRARYATIKNKLAHVDCDILDDIDGQQVRTSITWMLKKQNVGWRISGLLIEVEDSPAMDLLSFENALDVEKIKQLAAGDLIDDPTTRQAEVPTDNQIK